MKMWSGLVPTQEWQAWNVIEPTLPYDRRILMNREDSEVVSLKWSLVNETHAEPWLRDRAVVT